MLLAATHNRRFLELVQIGLTFMSLCAVVDASRAAPLDPGAGYETSVPQRTGREADRRLSDLVRAERKRREADLERSRRGFGLGQTKESVLP